MSFLPVAAADSLWIGEMLGVVVGQVKVLLVNLDGTIHAFENRCAHQGVELSGGRLENGVLTCPAHEWQYDMRQGCGLNPRSVLLRRFAVKIEDNQILVDVSHGPGRA